MAEKLKNTAKTVFKGLRLFVVEESEQPTEYASVIAGTTTLPAASIITLIDEDDVQTVKLSLFEGSTWIQAVEIGTTAEEI